MLPEETNYKHFFSKTNILQPNHNHAIIAALFCVRVRVYCISGNDLDQSLSCCHQFFFITLISLPTKFLLICGLPVTSVQCIQWESSDLDFNFSYFTKKRHLVSLEHFSIPFLNLSFFSHEVCSCKVLKLGMHDMLLFS